MHLKNTLIAPEDGMIFGLSVGLILGPTLDGFWHPFAAWLTRDGTPYQPKLIKNRHHDPFPSTLIFSTFF